MESLALISPSGSSKHRVQVDTGFEWPQSEGKKALKRKPAWSSPSLSSTTFFPLGYQLAFTNHKKLKKDDLCHIGLIIRKSMSIIFIYQSSLCLEGQTRQKTRECTRMGLSDYPSVDSKTNFSHHTSCPFHLFKDGKRYMSHYGSNENKTKARVRKGI